MKDNTCPLGSFPCRADATCLASESLCDFTADCSDSSDEADICGKRTSSLRKGEVESSANKPGKIVSSGGARFELITPRLCVTWGNDPCRAYPVAHSSIH